MTGRFFLLLLLFGKQTVIFCRSDSSVTTL